MYMDLKLVMPVCCKRYLTLALNALSVQQSSKYPNPYGKYLKTIVKCAIENCDESMRYAAKDLVDRSINVGVSTKIAVSVDGTWQKRYGHDSLLGGTFVISIENGIVFSMILQCL